MLLGRIAALALTPGSPVYHRGEEVIVASGSIDQARLLARACAAALAVPVRWTGLTATTAHRIVGVTKCGTTLRVISSSGKRSLGLGAENRLLLCDEPARWEERSGALLFESMVGALAKIRSRLLLIGTLSPSRPGLWWPDLVQGVPLPGQHLQLLQAHDDEPWDSWPVIRRSNPVLGVHPGLRRRVLRERDEARANPDARRRFEAWRLNRLREPGREMLVSVEEYRAMIARDVPDRDGRPVVGIDTGATSAWTAAAALWPNGRVETMALVGGATSLHDRERRDGVARGAYQRLADSGALLVDEGRHLPRLDMLVEAMRRRGWWPPMGVVCDTFRAPALRDAIGPGVPLVVRRSRWSEASEDVGHMRRMVLDGPPLLAVDPGSEDLLRHSLGEAAVERDTSANVRVRKRRREARDDVAVALTLACGAIGRRPAPRPIRVLVA